MLLAPQVLRFDVEWPSASELLDSLSDEQPVPVFRQEEPGAFAGASEQMAFKEFRSRWLAGEDVFLGNAALDRHLGLPQRFPLPLAEPCDSGNVWVGCAGHASHLHMDYHPGVLSVLSGRKRCLLWPPSVRFPFLEDARGVINASSFNPARDGPPPEPPLEFELSAGDSLVIPMFWWHFCVCVTPCVAVNHWVYPHEPSLELRFSQPLLDLVMRRELLLLARHHLVNHCRQPYELLAERSLRAIFAASLRGAHALAHRFPDFRHFIVDAAQTALSEHKDKK